MTTAGPPRRRPTRTPTAVTLTRGDPNGIRIPFGDMPAEWSVHGVALVSEGTGGTLREWFQGDGGVTRDGEDVVLDSSDSASWSFDEARLLVEFLGEDGAGVTRGPVWLKVIDA